MILESILGLLYFLVVGSNIVLAVFTLYVGRTNRINITFSAISFLLALWVISSYFSAHYFPEHLELASFWFRMRYMTIIPVPSLFLYFSTIFPEYDEKHPMIRRSILIFMPLPFLYAMQFLGLLARSIQPSANGSIEQLYGSFVPVFLTYFIGYFALNFAILTRKYFRLRGISRIRLQYVFVGALFPVIIGTMGNLIFPLLGIEPGALYYLGPLSTVFIVVMIFSAIVKHKLFLGFNYIFGKGIVYTIMAGFITTAYFGVLLIMARFFQAISGNYSLLVGFLFFVIFALVFGPIKDRLQKLVDSFLFKSRLDYEKTLRQTSSAMNFIYNRERLLSLTARLLVKRMRLSGAALFLYDELRREYVIKGAGGLCKSLAGRSMSSDNPLVNRLEETKSYVFRPDIERTASDVFVSDYEKKEHEAVLAEMDKLNIQMCYPSILKGNIIAFLALGSKISGDPFDEEDIAFLGALASQSAIFLENFVLAEKEKERAEAFAEAETRDKYTAMLEKMNKELMDTREELVKSERLATLTMLSVSLQHEINDPLSLIVQEAGRLSPDGGSAAGDRSELLQSIALIEKQAKKIRELLRNLANITDPVTRDYPIMTDTGAALK